MKRIILSIILLTILILSGCGGSGGGGGSKNKYTLDISKTGSGTVTVSPVMERYPAGTSVKLSAKPDAGSIFSNWQDSSKGYVSSLIEDDSFNIIMDSNKRLHAYFAKENAFYLSGLPNDDGSYNFIGIMSKMEHDQTGFPEELLYYDNAKFLVNATSLTFDGHRLYSADVSISPGDKVNIVFEHNLIGTFSATLTCPGKEVTGLTLVPGGDLDAWIKGAQSTVSLSWDATICDEYNIHIEALDNENNPHYVGFGSKENSFILSEKERELLLNLCGGNISYIVIYIEAVSEKQFPEFISSYFAIRSLRSNELSSLPEDMSQNMIVFNKTNATSKRVRCKMKDVDGQFIQRYYIEQRN